MATNINHFSGKIDSIQCLRTLAFLGVMCYHAGTVNNIVPSFQAGVNLFFCLSGFFAMFSTQKKTKGYLLKRLIRILPLYWIMTTVTFVAIQFGILDSQGEVGVTEFVKSLLLIPYHRGGMKSTSLVVRPIVGPAWTLFYDVVFTLVFYIGMKISWKRRGIIACIVCLIFTLGGLLFSSESAVMSIVFDEKLRWISFAAGILCYEVNKGLWYKTEKITVSKGRVAIGTMTILVGICLLFYVGQNQPIDSLISFALLTVAIQCLGRTKCPSILVHIGDVGYSAYLLHYYVIVMFGFAVNWNELSFITLMAFGGASIVTIILSTICYRIVELGIGNFLRNKLIS